MEQKTWLDEFHEAHNQVFEIPYQLCELADALDRVGNRGVAEELRDYAITIGNANKQMQTSIGRMLHEQVQGGEKQIAEILTAVLKTPTKEVK